MVLILNPGVLNRFLPNNFVKEFVVVDSFVKDFTLGFLSCCGGNSVFVLWVLVRCQESVSVGFVVTCRVMLGEVICQVLCAQSPVISELSLSFASS
jgi:hypothetical protein